MYKFVYVNVTTNTKFIEYGFSRYIFKRLLKYIDDENFEIRLCASLAKCLSNFWKCLIKKTITEAQ